MSSQRSANQLGTCANQPLITKSLFVSLNWVGPVSWDATSCEKFRCASFDGRAVPMQQAPHMRGDTIRTEVADITGKATTDEKYGRGRIVEPPLQA
jgi:hypothetical protein